MVHFLSSPDSLLPNDFSGKQLEHFIIRKSGKGDGQADMSGKLVGDDVFFGTEDGLHPVKQTDRPADDVSHLFRAVFTLGLNHITGAAVQSHFRRLLCLGCCFFSLFFVFEVYKIEVPDSHHGVTARHFVYLSLLFCFLLNCFQ